MNRMRNASRSDQGSALVAAVGVAIIGISLCVIVVTQAIVVVRDSQRDSVRTSEVHAAEAAIDAAMVVLATSTPCPSPSFSPLTTGDGQGEVSVSVTIKYVDASGNALTCNSGSLSGTPAGASIVATSVPVLDSYGIEPERTFEARVNIDPIEGEGSAIFAASGMLQGGSGFALIGAPGEGVGNVIVDSGDFSCASFLNIDGNLIVPQGKVTFQNADCEVQGSVFAKTGMEIHSYSKKNGVMVGDGITVQNGNFVVHQKNIQIVGDVKISGTLTEGAGSPGLSITGGALYTGATIANVPSQGMPQVYFDPAAWASNGWDVRTPAQFLSDVKAAMVSVGLTPQSWHDSSLKSCELANWVVGSNPLPMPSGKIVYDLRTCDSKRMNFGNVKLAITDDLAFIAPTFTGYGLEVTSADGDNHSFHMIVPVKDSGSPPGYTEGNIDLSSALKITDPIEVFAYTPKSLIFHNDFETWGQLYGNTVDVHSKSFFVYKPTGAEILGSSGSATSGFEVTLVYKREVK